MTTPDVQPVSCLDVADKDSWKITKHRSIRLEKPLWNALDRSARSVGHDRSSVIRQLVRWYLQVPGAELPQRSAEPPVIDWDDKD